MVAVMTARLTVNDAHHMACMHLSIRSSRRSTNIQRVNPTMQHVNPTALPPPGPGELYGLPPFTRPAPHGGPGAVPRSTLCGTPHRQPTPGHHDAAADGSAAGVDAGRHRGLDRTARSRAGAAALGVSLAAVCVHAGHAGQCSAVRVGDGMGGTATRARLGGAAGVDHGVDHGVDQECATGIGVGARGMGCHD